MGPTESTVWPSAPAEISPQLQKLITRFFEISDITDPSSGKLLADEIFTPDGVLRMGERMTYRGSEELASSRSQMHPVIASRQHSIKRVYVANSPGTDAMVIGHLAIQLKDDSSVDTEFVGRFLMTQRFEDEGKLELVQLWSDPSSMIAAFKRASEALARRTEH